jgi:hypothetical protein
MIVKMDVDQQNAATAIQCVTNAAPSDTEGLIVNLHPSFPIPKEQLHQDRIFPWLKHVQEVGQAQAREMGTMFGATSLEDLQALAQHVQPTLDAWAVAKKAWSLHRNGRSDLAANELRRYKTRGYSGPCELPNVLFHFSAVMLGPALTPVFTNVAQETAGIQSLAPNEFGRFRD